MEDSHIQESDHSCLLYSEANEQKGVVLSFIRDGLRSGECCLFIDSEPSLDDWSLELQAAGIDVQWEQERGALVLVPGEDMRRDSEFNPILIASDLWELIEDRLATFSGMRIIGDIEWTLSEPALPPEQLCRWEATADLLFQGERVKTICMYNRIRHTPSEIRVALRTHSRVLFEGHAYSNRFYEAASILENDPQGFNSDADRELIERMLSELGPRIV